MHVKFGEYVTLGRSGLRVSPLCLGTFTFGAGSIGTDEKASRSIFDHYVNQGGNFVDTADVYQLGLSEEILGKLISEAQLRDRIVLATKYTGNLTNIGDPNGGGNGRKNIYRALEGSLKRLRTDYIDLYWMHHWDMVTPVDEVVATMDALVRAGKVRHYGFSNVPAWYVAQAYTVAETQAFERVAALQLEYSLVERNIERDHIPLAREFGLAVCPWSPLAGGLLSGKYSISEQLAEPGRLSLFPDAPIVDRHRTPVGHQIVEALVGVAVEIGRPPAQVALNWVNTQAGVTSSIIGATKLHQLESNLSALAFEIPPHLRTRLDEVSRIATVGIHKMYTPFMQRHITGQTTVHRSPATDK